MPESRPLTNRLKTWPQHLLPQHGLTRLANSASNSRRLARSLIGAFRRLYPVDLDECRVPPGGFETFDAFFTRALKPDARRYPDDPQVVASPCDGAISQLGRVESGRVVQAKGRTFSVAELLTDEQRAETFLDGRFITLYLAPFDYHRVHMPFSGELVAEYRVPGRLFSVSAATSAAIDRLYARNERMVALFDTDFGPAAVVMVAAMLVAGIETAWDGTELLRPGKTLMRRAFEPPIAMDRGAELGRFHWGSTVILLLPETGPEWLDSLAPGQRARLGQPLSGKAGEPRRSGTVG